MTGTKRIPEPKGLNPVDVPWGRAVTEYINGRNTKDARVENALSNLNMSQNAVFTAIENQSGQVNAVAELAKTHGDILDAPSTPSAPSVPTVTSALGVVAAHWDGMLTDGVDPDTGIAYFALPVAGFKGVLAQVATTEPPAVPVPDPLDPEAPPYDGDWTVVGAPTSEAGDITFTAPSGSTIWVRLVAVNWDGAMSLPSGFVSIVVSGVEMSDLPAEIGTVIDTVDGLNKIFFEVDDGTSPVAHANGDLWFVVDAGTSSVVDVRSWNGSDWVPYQLVADSVIVPSSIGNILLADGAVTAPKILAQTITSNEVAVGTLLVSNLEPLIGEKINITSNEGLMIVAGDTAEALSQATVAQATAYGASSQASFAAEQAQVAQDAAAAAADDGKITRSVFDFNEDGLDISQPGGVYSLHLDNEGITINEGATPVSLWNAGQMIVDKFVGSEVVLANHKIESRGTRTVFRSM